MTFEVFCRLLVQEQGGLVLSWQKDKTEVAEVAESLGGQLPWTVAHTHRRFYV